MKIAGIVCEYNPFHNGHKYHISETKKQLKTDGVVCVMSGNFTQRGDVAVFPMEKRAEIAIKNGADLVLEIPPRFVLQSAQFYAHSAVYILNCLGVVDYLSFGSESGDIDKLEEALLNFDDNKFKEEIKSGEGYAKAVSNSEILKSPNNILAVEYLKALKSLSSKIVPFTIKRNAVSHDSTTTNMEYASASYIRDLIKENKDFSEFVPDINYYKNLKASFSEDFWHLIKYKLTLGKQDNFESILNISEGLNNRILKFSDSETLEECVDNICCKRYPRSRIRRALFSILLDMEKSHLPPTYTKVLAVNETGRKILATSRKTATIPILNRLTKKDIYNIPFLNEELISNKIIGR